MPKIARLVRPSDWNDLGFVVFERTPRRLMKLRIRLQLVGLSLSNTVSELENFGVERGRMAVPDWIQKADLQSTDDADPNRVAMDETVIQLEDERF